MTDSLSGSTKLLDADKQLKHLFCGSSALHVDLIYWLIICSAWNQGRFYPAFLPHFTLSFRNSRAQARATWAFSLYSSWLAYCEELTSIDMRYFLSGTIYLRINITCISMQVILIILWVSCQAKRQ